MWSSSYCFNVRVIVGLFSLLFCWPMLRDLTRAAMQPKILLLGCQTTTAMATATYKQQKPDTAVALLLRRCVHRTQVDEKFAYKKFGNVYQQNRETDGAFQKHFYHHQTIQQNTKMLFANDASFPFTILACLPRSFASCVVDETDSRFLRTLYASLPWFCIQLDFYAYYTQKSALTWPLLMWSQRWNVSPDSNQTAAVTFAAAFTGGFRVHCIW